MQEYATELLREFLGRVDELDGHLADLRGRYEETARDGTKKALGLLAHYPEHLREAARRHWQNATARPELAASGLVTVTKDLLSRAAVITTWFDAPDNTVIPRVLVDEVESACARLGLGARAAVLAVAGPSDFETFIGDFHEALFGDRPRTDFDTQLRTDFVLTTLPRREAASPRWWPVVLGHELAHLKLDALAAATSDHDGANVTDSTVADPLSSLGLRDVFPWEDVLRAIETTAAGSARGRDLTDQDKATALEEHYEMANNWLTELVCDAYMVYRFGPAAVAAMGSFLWGIGAGETTSPTHPSGSLRVQFMLELLGTWADPDGVFDAIVRPWREIASKNPASSLPAPERAIWGPLFALREGAWRLVGEWDPKPAYDPRDPRRRAAVLLAQRQLYIGLPPHNGVPNDLPRPGETTVPVSLTPAAVATLSDEDVVNAAWAVAADAEPFDETPRPPVDRLALKSVDAFAHERSERFAVVPPHPIRAGASQRAGGDEGGVLTRDALVTRMEQARDPWQRIVLVPYIENSVRNAAIDVRLGTRFITFQRSGTSVFAAKRVDSRAVQRLVEKGWDDPFVLHPGEMVLAATLEYLAVPRDLAAQLITRSSYGRLGLMTATAVQVHPLYRGCLTLELVNLGSVPIGLQPGERIAQVVFTTAQPDRPDPTPADLFSGKYMCATEPQFSRVELDRDEDNRTR